MGYMAVKSRKILEVHMCNLTAKTMICSKEEEVVVMVSQLGGFMLC